MSVRTELKVDRVWNIREDQQKLFNLKNREKRLKRKLNKASGTH